MTAEKRHYLGILDFRSEEPGLALDGWAKALVPFLTARLEQSTDLVILNREHLDRMVQERDLSGIELKLRSSAVLIEGGLRRVPGEGNLAVTVNLRPLVGSEVIKATVLVPSNDFLKACQHIADAIREKAGSVAPGGPEVDPVKEAAVFLRQTEYFLSRNDAESAVGSAEAAYALNPTPKTGLGMPHQGKAGVAVFDSGSSSFQMIASSTSAESRSGLDGGNFYLVKGLLADPKSKCVWVGIARGGFDRNGLW